MPHCIALFSGGLDSCLSIITLLRQGIKITALYFDTHFGCGLGSRELYLKKISDEFGFTMEIVDVGSEFLEIVKKPAYGYGKNMNPCLDCKIMMLSKAGDYMRQVGADFIATGEVVGQRPMSQQRHIFNMMEKRTALKGYILRPLSATVLPPTYPEIRGMVDRSRLHGIVGRKRHQQFALANEYGLKDYPSPSGGCLLTNPNYSLRLKELLSFKKDPDLRDLKLLKIGRHFRSPEGVKIIVGRNSADNDYLIGLSNEHDIVIQPLDTNGPNVVIPHTEVSDEVIKAGAGLCAYYSDGRYRDTIRVVVRRGDKENIVDARPDDAMTIHRYMIRL
ncbi:MAG: hypothetical protein SNJ53_02320 [Thermodesulfovibrionales bacterium]